MVGVAQLPLTELRNNGFNGEGNAHPILMANSISFHLGEQGTRCSGFPALLTAEQRYLQLSHFDIAVCCSIKRGSPGETLGLSLEKCVSTLFGSRETQSQQICREK